MTLSIFTTVTKPLERQDPFLEAIDCYLDLADEVVIVDGSLDGSIHTDLLPFKDDERRHKIKTIHSPWPEEFEWPFIGEQFQKGLDACSGDWVIRCDLDYFFHENDIPKIRHLLDNAGDACSFSFYKWQFLKVDSYNLKSRTVIAFNKARLGSSLRLNGGGDLCQPTIQGMDIAERPEARLPYWNYDFCFKELSTIEKDWPRFRAAWIRHFGEGNDFGEFKDMMVGRFIGRSWQHVLPSQHPKYIRERVENIQPNQFGHSMFGWLDDHK